MMRTAVCLAMAPAFSTCMLRTWTCRGLPKGMPCPHIINQAGSGEPVLGTQKPSGSAVQKDPSHADRCGLKQA